MSSSVFEGRWRLCRGDVRRQAIPDSRCSHSKDSIADCFQSGAPDDQFVTRRRSESLTWVIVNCPLQVSLSPGILVPCYCGNGTQERPDGTQYVLRCQCRSRSRGVMVVFLAVAHQSCCRRSCKRRDIPMRFTLPSVFENTYFMFFFRFPKNMAFYVFLKWRIKKS